MSAPTQPPLPTVPAMAPRAIAEAAMALLRRQQALDELSPAARAVEERALAKETATLETALNEQNISAQTRSGESPSA